MHMLWKRWSRAGYMPPWFYAVVGSGFVAVTIAAFTRGEWIVGGFAFVMVGVTIAAARYMPMLARGLRESTRRYYGNGAEREADER